MAQKADPTDALRVLVVEDEGLIAEELNERLTHLGLNVVGMVDSGELAFDAAMRAQPDLILMDVRLKGELDGIQVASDIRRELDVPIIYLTAHSDATTVKRAGETAPFAYLLKPLQERELVVAIEMTIHRHALERQLRESERKHVATLSSIGDAVIGTDLDGRVTFMNPTAEALTGWPLQDARGHSVDEVFQVGLDAQGSTTINPLAQALRERKAVKFDGVEMFLLSRNNEAIPIDDCAAPIVDERQRTIGAVVAFRDIRDRRLAQDALQRAREELFQSQKMESIGRLAAGIAHDFNNLLTIINGCSELALGKSDLDDTTHELLHDIHQAGIRAASLTRQFLAFGRRQMRQPRVVDLNGLVINLAAMLRRLIGEDITLTTDLDARTLSVLADPTQLEQVIVNLAVNARDAMPDGGELLIATSRTTIEAKTSERSLDQEPGPYAVLRVTDSGRGIDQALKHQIFEPYFTTKEVGKGSGLGLATVYGIVRQSGGFIEVESEPGRGTSFEISLPLVEGVAPTDTAIDESTAPRSVVSGKENILLVEDEGPVRALLASVLRRHGYTVIEAGDGEEGLRQFETHRGRIQLTITDLIMPGMRGTALVERLRASNPGLRVLYISGYAEDGESLSADSFLPKPFTPAVLARKVRELLDR